MRVSQLLVGGLFFILVELILQTFQMVFVENSIQKKDGFLGIVNTIVRLNNLPGGVTQSLAYNDIGWLCGSKTRQSAKVCRQHIFLGYFLQMRH